MGPKSNPSYIRGGEARRKELHEEPKSEEDEGRDFDELKKEKDRY
jgi:hypothetical protein